MAQMVSRRLLNAETRFRSQVSPRGLCDRQSVIGTGFSPNTAVFSCQYHSTNAPHPSSSTSCSYQKDKRVKPGILTSYTNVFT
jgi:hypothetical protein